MSPTISPSEVRETWIADADRTTFREGVAAFFRCSPDEVRVEVDGHDLLTGARVPQTDDEFVTVWLVIRGFNYIWLEISGEADRLDLLHALDGLLVIRKAGNAAICLSDEGGLKSIPGDFAQTVIIHDPKIQTLPNFFALSRVNQLIFFGCSNIENISNINNSKMANSIFISFCGKIENISQLGLLRNITALSLLGCASICDLAPLTGLNTLISLNLSRCESISDLSPLSGLTALTALDLSQCESISDLSPLSGLTALTALDLSQCESIIDLSPLAGMKALTALDLSGCESITDLSPLVGMTALTLLNLHRCLKINDLSPLAGMTALASLNLHRCSKITDLSPLAGMTALRSLHLWGCSKITDLSPLAGMTALNFLNLDLCSSITDLSPLAGITALTSLDLGHCSSISDLSPLAGMTVLKTLDLSWCESITDLSPLSGMTALTSLTLSKLYNYLNKNSITDLSPLSGMMSLTFLDLNGCKSITDLSPLLGMTALTSLDLHGCESITDLSPLSSMAALTSLDLYGCILITNLSPLVGMTALHSLKLSGCNLITDLSPLVGMTALTSLDLSGCESITDLSVLGKLTRLEKLDLTGCPSIHESTLLELANCPRLKELQYGRTIPVVRVRLMIEERHQSHLMEEQELQEGLRHIQRSEAHERNELVGLFARALARSYLRDPWIAELVDKLVASQVEAPTPDEQVTEDMMDLLVAVSSQGDWGLETAGRGIERIAAVLTQADRWRTHLVPLIRPLVLRLPSLAPVLFQAHLTALEALVDDLTQPATAGVLRQLAPAMALALYRLGRETLVQRWLEGAAKVAEADSLLDELHLVLGKEDLIQGRVDRARSRMERIGESLMRDELAALLIRMRPLDEAAWSTLMEITDPQTRGRAAADLMETPTAATELGHFMALAEAMREDPKKMARLLEQAMAAGQVAARLAQEAGGVTVVVGEVPGGALERLARHVEGLPRKRQRYVEATVFRSLEKDGLLTEEEATRLQGEEP